jgi:hypothetical protein
MRAPALFSKRSRWDFVWQFAIATRHRAQILALTQPSSGHQSGDRLDGALDNVHKGRDCVHRDCGAAGSRVRIGSRTSRCCRS